MDKPKIPPAGWRRKEWCLAAGMAVSTSYTLPPEIKPAYVKIGKMVIFTESPEDWLKRVAALQRAAN